MSESEEGDEVKQESLSPPLCTVSPFESQDESVPHLEAAGNKGASGTAATIASTSTHSTHSAPLRPRVFWNRKLHRTASGTAPRDMVEQKERVEAARPVEKAPSSSAPQGLTSQDDNIIGDTVQHSAITTTWSCIQEPYNFPG